MAYLTDIDGTIHLLSVNGLVHCYHGIGAEHRPHYSPPIDMAKAAKVKDWRDGGKMNGQIMAQLRAAGWQYEARYDATHGRRYQLAVYPANNRRGRECTIASCDGIHNIRKWALDSGVLESELPALGAFA